MVMVLLFAMPCALADQIILSYGAGPQPESNQKNRLLSIDYSFYEKVRSVRSKLSFGASYIRLKTNTDDNSNLEVFSVYPQLTLTPVNKILRGSYFFVRALGPSYISHNQLGSRQQTNNFAFQAQVGVGYRVILAKRNTLLLQLSWKHFSNASLFEPNDGIDIPVVFSFGYDH